MNLLKTMTMTLGLLSGGLLTLPSQAQITDLEKDWIIYLMTKSCAGCHVNWDAPESSEAQIVLSWDAIVNDASKISSHVSPSARHSMPPRNAPLEHQLTIEEKQYLSDVVAKLVR